MSTWGIAGAPKDCCAQIVIVRTANLAVRDRPLAVLAKHDFDARKLSINA